jgi:hypothetical protein
MSTAARKVTTSIDEVLPSFREPVVTLNAELGGVGGVNFWPVGVVLVVDDAAGGVVVVLLVGAGVLLLATGALPVESLPPPPHAASMTAIPTAIDTFFMTFQEVVDGKPIVLTSRARKLAPSRPGNAPPLMQRVPAFKHCDISTAAL